MPYADARGVQIYYEVDGEPTGRPLVLLAGTGAQYFGWRDELTAQLVEKGFRVIRPDNRDVGLSQKFGGPKDIDGGYELGDMATDIIGVLDAEGLESAHVAGHSMGGMLAQMMAIEHPGRVRSMGLFSTLPGQNPAYLPEGDAHPELEQVPKRYPRALVVSGTVAYMKAAHNGSYPFDKAWAKEGAERAFDRCYAPDGAVRQWSAMLRAPERLEWLRSVTVPTLVYHGREDDVVLWRAAVDMAQTIADSELHVLPGVSHELPTGIWPEMIADLVRMADRGDARCNTASAVRWLAQ